MMKQNLEMLSEDDTSTPVIYVFHQRQSFHFSHVDSLQECPLESRR